MAVLGSISRKRKSDGPPEESIDLDDYDLEVLPIDKNPDQVRRQIRHFLDSGGMKVGDFYNALDASNDGYNRLMQQSGKKKGMGSDVYQEAWSFFAKREMAGLKMPTKKQKTSSSAGGAASSASKGAQRSTDISAIQLDGEDQDDVALYDSCDEVRKKITAHLGKQDVTKAQFCRNLKAQLQREGALQA